MRLSWSDPRIPENFLKVVAWCYTSQLFWWSHTHRITIGHYCTKIEDEFFTSHREDGPSLPHGLHSAGRHNVNPPKQSMIHFHCPKKGEIIAPDGIICYYDADHGPKILFDADVPAAVITKFITDNFDINVRTTAI
jgi:hypothetical protein